MNKIVLVPSLIVTLLMIQAQPSEALYSTCGTPQVGCVACNAPVYCCQGDVVWTDDDSTDQSGNFCTTNGGGNGSLGCTEELYTGGGPLCVGGIDQCTGAICAPPPPPGGPCGAGMICGTLHSESGAALSGLTMLLRNARGQVIHTTQTDATGNYSFSVPDLATYLVYPGLSRLENSAPSYRPLTATFAGDFIVRGVPAFVQMTGLVPGEFVLFSNEEYTAQSAPPVYAGMPVPYWSFVAGLDGTLTAKVPGDSTYWVTCWAMTPAGIHRSQSMEVSSSALLPESTVTAACQ